MQTHLTLRESKRTCRGKSKISFDRGIFINLIGPHCVACSSTVDYDLSQPNRDDADIISYASCAEHRGDRSTRKEIAREAS